MAEFLPQAPSCPTGTATGPTTAATRPAGAAGRHGWRRVRWRAGVVDTMSLVSDVQPPAVDAPAVQSRLSAWQEVLRTTNPPTGRPLDPVSRWLVLTRAAVLPMTLVAGAVATLLAVHRHGFRPGLLILAFAGLILAHVANNL